MEVVKNPQTQIPRVTEPNGASRFLGEEGEATHHLVDQGLPTRVLTIAENLNVIEDTALNALALSWDDLCRKLETPEIGLKKGTYFIRCTGTRRTDQDTGETASILILDGDSSLDESGQVLAGAPHPKRVSVALRKLGLAHCIYSSHSNGKSREDIDNENAKKVRDWEKLPESTRNTKPKLINSGGQYGKDFHKYRVVIPGTYSRVQLPILLDFLHEELRKAGVALFNVKENSRWSQGWYYPRTPNEKRKDLFKFLLGEGNWLDADLICAGREPLPPPIEPEPIVRKYRKLLPGKVCYIEEFNKQHTCSDILKRNGYSQKGDRYLRPGSETGAPAIQFCRNCKDGVERIYSHGNDDLNDGRAHDAFDCYLILECAGDFNQAQNWNPELTQLNTKIWYESENEPDVADHIEPELIYEDETTDDDSRSELIRTFPTDILRKTHDFYKQGSAKATHNLSMLGVISLASAVTNRIFVTDEENMTPLYLCGIAPTGKGKNNPKEITYRLLQESELSLLIGAGNFTGSSALRSLLVKYPARLMILDEFGDKLAEALNNRNALMTGGFSALKDLFSDCHGVHVKQAMADSGRRNKNAEKNIVKPCLTMLGLSTPTKFHEALDGHSLEGGFINRLIIVDASGDDVIRNFGRKSVTPDWLKKHLDQFYNLRNRANQGQEVNFEDIGDQEYDSDPDLIEIPFSKKAAERCEELDYIVEEKAASDEFVANLTVRWREQTMRMALVLTAFEDPEAKEVSLETVEWCWGFISYHGDRFINAHRNKPESKLEIDRDAILEAIRGKRRQGMTKKQLGQVKRFKSLGAKSREDLIKVLVDDELIHIVEEKNQGPGRKKIIYYATK